MNPTDVRLALALLFSRSVVRFALRRTGADDNALAKEHSA